METINLCQSFYPWARRRLGEQSLEEAVEDDLMNNGGGVVAGHATGGHFC